MRRRQVARGGEGGVKAGHRSSTGLRGKYSEGSRAAWCERRCVARGWVMCANDCAAGSYGWAAVQEAKSRVVGLCDEGVGVVGVA